MYDTVGEPPSAENCASHMPSLKAQEQGESEVATAALSRGHRFANSIVHSTGQQTHVLKALQNKYLHYSPANPFLDTRRLISHSRPLLAIWNDVSQPFII